MKKTTIRVFDKAKTKRVFTSIKSKCPIDLKTTIFSHNPCLPKGKIKKSVEWLNQFNDEQKYYFINHVLDNSDTFGHTPKDVLVNISIFRELLTTNLKLVDVIHYINDNKNHKAGDSKIELKDPTKFPEYEFDFTDYGSSDYYRDRLNHFGYKVGDVVRDGRRKNDKWIIDKIDDKEWEESIKDNFRSASTGLVVLRNEETQEIFKVGIDYLKYDCNKKVKK